MAAAQLELTFLVSDGQQMNVSWSVFVQWHWFEEDVLAASLGFVDVNQFEESLAFLKDIWVALFADFAFKFLPIVRCDILAVLFHVSLRLDPVFEALIVDVAYRAGALACQDQRILIWLLSASAKAALYGLFTIFTNKNNKSISFSYEILSCFQMEIYSILRSDTYAKSLDVFTDCASLSSWL